MLLLKPPGVYRPQADTWLLADALRAAAIRPGGSVLDVGTGTGVLSVLAARAGAAEVTAVDVCARAVFAARLNAFVRGLRVVVERGDLLQRVANRRFDLVLANPPYVPSEQASPPRGEGRAWEAGARGRQMLDVLCLHGPRMLTPGGTMLLVHSAVCDVEATLGQLSDGGLKAAVVARKREPFGPVMQARLTFLRAAGLIRDDDVDEELVVIRADQPG